MIRTPALAIGYYFWLRTRWLLATFLLAMVAITAFSPQYHHFGIQSVALVTLGSIICFGFIFVMLAARFCYTGADVSMRESAFPRWMMTAPMRPTSLVGWPMLYGGVISVLLTAIYTLGTLGLMGLKELPIWPMAAAAAFCAWLQALSWTPFWFRMARVAVAVPVLFICLAMGVAAQGVNVPQGVVLLAYLALLLLAYICAVAGITRARRGDGVTPPWARHSSVARKSSSFKPRDPFASPSAALSWIDRRRNMLLMPVFSVATPLFLFMMVLFHIGHPSPIYLTGGKVISISAITVLIFILSPLFCSMFLNGTLAKFDTWLPAITVPTYVAVRPMTVTQMVGVKFRTTAIATLWSWVPSLLLLAILVFLPKSYQSHRSLASLIVEHFSWRYLAWAVAALLGLILFSWKTAIQGLWVYLYGRRWTINTVGLGSIFFWFVVALAWRWGGWATVGPMLPKIIVGLVVAKALLCVGALRAIYVRRLATIHRLMTWIVVWLLVGIALWGAARAVLEPRWIGAWMLAGAVLLFVPANRLLLAPLALRANRHR